MDKDLDFLFKSLYLSMEQEYDRYGELLAAIEEEGNTLINCTSKDIINFNLINERLLLSVNMASDIRMNAIDKIFSHLHLDKPVTMGQLIAYAPDHIRQNLIDHKEKFAEILSKIRRTNNHNREMIAASLSHINNTLNYIDMLTCPSPNYDRNGQIKAGNLQSRLISEAG